MVKDAYRFAIPPMVLGILCLGFGWYWAAGILIFLGLFVFYFFRDPERTIPSDPDCRGVARRWARGGDRGRTLDSVGWAIASAYFCRSGMCTCSARRLRGESPAWSTARGSFMPRCAPRLRRKNEQNVIYMETPRGTVVFKQIAGAIARRVICWKREGEMVALGERVGMIRFGSRVDIWLPMETQVVVTRGQKVKGGESVLAKWNSTT